MIPAKDGSGSLKDNFLSATGISSSLLATVKLRYKAPNDESTLIEVPIYLMAQSAAGPSPDSYREEFLQMVKRAQELSS